MSFLRLFQSSSVMLAIFLACVASAGVGASWAEAKDETERARAALSAAPIRHRVTRPSFERLAVSNKPTGRGRHRSCRTEATNRLLRLGALGSPGRRLLKSTTPRQQKCQQAKEWLSER